MFKNMQSVLKNGLFALVLGFALISGAKADDTAALDAAIAEADAAYPAHCVAMTTCFRPWGPAFTIACQTFGYGCSRWIVPNNSVQCTGLDAWGRWVNLYYRCW
jgi:hypothetical protein